jgi:hypothetical protein
MAPAKKRRTEACSLIAFFKVTGSWTSTASARLRDSQGLSVHMECPYSFRRQVDLQLVKIRESSANAGTTMAYTENYNAMLARNFVQPQPNSGAAARVNSALLERLELTTGATAPPIPVAAPALSTASITRRAPSDVRVPCMVYAAVGALSDAASDLTLQAMLEVRKAPGVLNVFSYTGGTVDGSLACSDGVAVVTRGYWLARQLLARLVDQCGDLVRPLGAAGGDDSVDPVAPTLSSLTASSAACTAQLYRGLLRIWMSTSDPVRVRSTAARIAGVAPDAVDLRVLGNTDTPHGLAVLVPAIALARELQSAPVQLIVAYDLGLRCQTPALAEAARSPWEVPARAKSVALAA